MFYHIRTHFSTREYACTECDKSFIQKCGLDQHLLQAHGAGKTLFMCPCPGCEHTSKTKNNTVIHIARKHSEAWIPRAETSGENVCGNCSKVCGSATAYYYHATTCYGRQLPELKTLIASIVIRDK